MTIDPPKEPSPEPIYDEPVLSELIIETWVSGLMDFCSLLQKYFIFHTNYKIWKQETLHLHLDSQCLDCSQASEFSSISRHMID
jgi:hypothetical protein